MMQAGKLNILITAPSLDTEKNISGISSVVQMIIKHNDNHFYHHYLLGKPDNKNVLIQILLLLKQLLSFPFALWENNIDIVHQNFPFNPKGILREFVINQYCRLFRIPVVLHIHGGIFLMKKTANKLYLFLVKEILKNSKAVIVLSNVEKELLHTNYRYINSFILENSIDASLFLSIKRDNTFLTPTFLFMGRIHKSKGLNDILEAFERLKKDGVGFKFLLCGDGPLKKSIVPQFKALLKTQFEYWGIVSGQRKFDAIRSADCFLLPSRYGEGLPVALLETMATGLVPIVTDDASMKYIIENEQNGMIIEKRSPEDLYRKMKKLILNPNLYESFSMNARNTIAERCDVKNYIFQLNFIYEFVKTH
jgi:glycosyltransferase involved in cell wall biosynthesis